MRKISTFTQLLSLCLLIGWSAFAQAQGVLRGTVIDGETGEPLIGVNVTAEGIKKGAATNINGIYSMELPYGDYTISAAYVGYETQKKEVKIDSRVPKTIKFELKQSSETMDEVVVIASTTKERKAVATSTISTESIKIRGISSGKKGSRKAKKRSKTAGFLSKTAKKPSTPATYSAPTIVAKDAAPAAPKRDVVTRATPPPPPPPPPVIEEVPNEIVEESIEFEDLSTDEEDLNIDVDLGATAEEKEFSEEKDPSSGTLTAGEIHDFSKWDLWKDISKNQLNQWQQLWKVKLTNRYTVQVMNQKGMPIVDSEVRLLSASNNLVWTSRTDNTGKAELWLNAFNNNVQSAGIFIEVVHDGQIHKIDDLTQFQKGVNTLTIQADCEMPNQVDVLFVVDATGSMQDEIDYLKVELKDVIARVQSDRPELSVNLGSVFYRDVYDAYLTRKADLSDDIGKTLDFIKNQNADGGGDFPEAVDAALEIAIDEMPWSDNAAARLLFLVLDAPPHSEDEVLQKMQGLMKKAAEKGIRIIPVTGSGIDKSTEYLMRALSLTSNGTYVFLTDDSGVGGKHIKPTTDEFKVELLNDLLVRLFNQFTQMPTCEGDQIFAIVPPNQTDPNTLNPDESDLKYYPNPTSGPLTLELKEAIPEIFVTDIAGKIVQRHTRLQTGKIRIDLGNFPSGVYFLKYMKDGKSRSKKVVVLHKN